METASPDWSNLPDDILQLILKLMPFIDTLRFRQVCSSWRAIAKTHLSLWSFYGNNSLIQPPWLMLPSFDSDPLTGTRFFDVGGKKFHHLNIDEKRCVGSSKGWLVCLDGEKTPFLFNPFFDVRIRPCLLYNLMSITKAILWADPILSDNNYGIVAIYGFPSDPKKISFAKCGDSEWSFLQGAYEEYCDIMCCIDTVFALADDGSVEAWDFSSSDFPVKVMEIEPYFTKKSVIFIKSLGNHYSSQCYLVESLGELLLVIRYIRHIGEIYDSRFFCVYKLDFKRGKWRQLDSLGDQVLFLGGNESISLSAKEFPGYKLNSIYFTDDCWDHMDEHRKHGLHDSGIFSMGDGYIFGICSSQIVQPPPFWVVPNLAQMHQLKT